jgi:hypothetical protein
VRHFLEMCIAMCVGGTILKVTVFGIASLAGLDPRDDVPELSLLVIALCYVAPMAAWMSYRGMGSRPNLEMSGATFALAVAVAASGSGWCPIRPKYSELASRVLRPSLHRDADRHALPSRPVHGTDRPSHVTTPCRTLTHGPLRRDSAPVGRPTHRERLQR